MRNRRRRRHTPVNQLLYDGLLLLQHRGQDAAGIVTGDGAIFHMHKGSGYVRDVFRTRNMRDLSGTVGIGHCRYPTAGSAVSELESQPFYVNSPFGIVLAHNGNLTNTEALKRELFQLDLPPRQHQLRFRGAAQRARARTASAPPSTRGSTPTRSSPPSPACTGAVAAPTRSWR